MSGKLDDNQRQFTSLVDVLVRRSQEKGSENLYTFLLDGEDEAAHLSYIETEQRARSLAALLQSEKSEGQRALLLYPPGLDYIAAFFGCLYAKVVAVPA